MKTLKQIRQEQKDKIREIFPARSKFADLSDEEQDECLKEWLTLKREFYAEHTNIHEQLFIDLLEELKHE